VLVVNQRYACVSTNLPYTATSLAVPPGILITNTLYNLAVSFVAGQMPGGKKASIRQTRFLTGTAEIGPLHIWHAVELGWLSRRGMKYQVQYTDDLVSKAWVNLDGVVLGNGDTNTMFDSTRGSAKEFYRVIRAE
jgi:hypothetical protein